MKKNTTLNLTCSALCLALCIILPFLTGQIPQIGNMLCPMHIPVILCGFICGPFWGLLIGIIAPLLRSLIFSVPVMYPMALSMAAELGTYGLLSGLLYRAFPKKTQYTYLTLIAAMLTGRLVWGAVRFIMAGLDAGSFPFSAFLAGAVTNAVPGIILQIAVIPPVVRLSEKLLRNER